MHTPNIAHDTTQHMDLRRAALCPRDRPQLRVPAAAGAEVPLGLVVGAAQEALHALDQVVDLGDLGRATPPPLS